MQLAFQFLSFESKIRCWSRFEVRFSGSPVVAIRRLATPPRSRPWVGRWCTRTVVSRRRRRRTRTSRAVPAARRRWRLAWTRRSSRAGSPRWWRAAGRARRAQASRRARCAAVRRRWQRSRWHAWNGWPAGRTEGDELAGLPTRRGTETSSWPTAGTRRCVEIPSQTTFSLSVRCSGRATCHSLLQ